MKMIRLDRPPPLLVGVGTDIFDLRVEFDATSQLWRVAAFRFGNGFAEWVTTGKPSRAELVEAIATGIEIMPAVQVRFMVSQLVAQGRAESVETAHS